MKEHVIIGKDRTVTVPASLRKIGIQYDHNVNTITFDCPRYPDEDLSVDMSKMQVFINYMLPDRHRTLGASAGVNIRIDPDDETIMHFDWGIRNTVTISNGVLTTLICIKHTDADGKELFHWNTDLTQAFTVGEGMETSEEILEEKYDLITQLLSSLDATNTSIEAANARIDELKSDLSELEGNISTGKNLFNKETYKPNKRLDGSGNEGDYDGYFVSDYMSIKPSTNYKLNKGGNYAVVAWYDNNKNLLSAIVQSYTLPFLSPENAYYARFSFILGSGDAGTIQFEENSVSTDYEEYYTKQKYDRSDNFNQRISILENSTQDKSDNILKGKKVLWNGDSIIQTVTSTGEVTSGGFPKIIGDRNVMTYTNYGVGGTRISTYNSSGNSILERISSMDSDTDYAIFEGGINDAQNSDSTPKGTLTNGYPTSLNSDGEWTALDTSTFYGAMEQLCIKARYKWKNAKIGFILIYKARAKDNQEEYMNIQKEVLEKYGIPYLDLYHNGGINLQIPWQRDYYSIHSNESDSTLGDGLHPNDILYNLLSDTIENWMKTL